jgi:hypothetical protein
MKSIKGRPILDRAPSFVWALITVFISLFLLFFLGEFALVPLLSETQAMSGAYLMYSLILGISGFIICRHNPKSVWYVVLIINVFTILTVIGEYRTILGLLGIYNGIAFLSSVIGCIWGARKGKVPVRIVDVQTKV